MTDEILITESSSRLCHRQCIKPKEIEIDYEDEISKEIIFTLSLKEFLEISHLKTKKGKREPGRYQRHDLFIKVLSLLCLNLTDVSNFFSFLVLTDVQKPRELLAESQ